MNASDHLAEVYTPANTIGDHVLDEALDHSVLNESAAATAELAAQVLAGCQRILVFTGAGISTESGIPDFRGPNGVWRHRDPARYTLQRYIADADVRVERWRDRLEAWRFAPRPNAAHYAITKLQQSGRAPVVVTQNIDGLHQDAGTRNVIELHGTSRAVVCLDCGRRMAAEPVLERVREGEEDPRCERCGGLLKAATISFGQNLVARDINAAMREAELCDACLAIGSTLSVWPAANVPTLAWRNGARFVIVNDGATDLDHAADVLVSGGAGDVVPRIVGGLTGAT